MKQSIMLKTEAEICNVDDEYVEMVNKKVKVDVKDDRKETLGGIEDDDNDVDDHNFVDNKSMDGAVINA